MNNTTLIMIPEVDYKNLLQKVDTIFDSIVKETQGPVSEHLSKNEVLFLLGISRGTYWRKTLLQTQRNPRTFKIKKSLISEGRQALI